ncbi:MAG TPA: hypothetical protein PKZ68_02625 [Pseudomonadales bacterium]|nr:hypothetical protein [Pseudomonadales bacterium]HNL91456.1 hypothetical protein [Pseudomonadales bacterium]
MSMVCVTRDELKVCLRADDGMPGDIRSLLVREGFVSEEQLFELMEERGLSCSNYAALGALLNSTATDGMVPLTEMALNAARERKTSIDEVFRVRLT